MSVDEEVSGIDSEEMIDEGNGDTVGTELTEVSGLNGQIGEGEETNEVQTEPLPEERNLTTERPIGVEDRVIQEQEQEKTSSGPKSTSKPSTVRKSKQEELSHKNYDQLVKQLQSNKTSDTLKQIQRRLTQIDKNTTSTKKQQEVMKQLLVQVGNMKRQLDKINSAISRSKTSSKTGRKKGQILSRKSIKGRKGSK